MTQQEITAMIADYENGIILDGLIKKYHHCHATIRKILEDNNIHIRNQSESNKGKYSKKISKEIENKIIENYNNGMGLIASGREFNVSNYIVRRILVDNGIHIRSYGESASVSNKNRRKYHCNEHYFKEQNSDMAYILGFFAADGTVRKDNNEIKITLAKKDADILEKIKDRLEYDGNIKYTTTNKGFDIATLTITCQEYKKDLADYNIVPQKTFTFSIPEKLKKEYWIDFIRGYWDGDGTICTAGKSAIRSSVCSAQRGTLQQILNFLEEKYDIPKVSIQVKDGKNPLYYIQYSNSSTKKLFKAFYYKNDLLYLERKYKKFCELCIDNKIHETAHPKC